MCVSARVWAAAAFDAAAAVGDAFLSLWRNSQEIGSGRPTGVCSPPLLL